jgi:GT2 family glycosyltransferase
MRRKKKPVIRSGRRAGLRDLAARRAARYQEGVQQGYEQGVQAGFTSYEALFDGTSIILPICNERDAVMRCIEVITDMTDLPYEIIVIDNGSQDGVEHNLKQLDGQVRYRLLHDNIGFGAAVNRGLMMAKGTTILLMSCQLQPTELWLEHMLACLEQDENIGLVGPVSGGFTGDQRVCLDFVSLEQMHEAARVYNETRRGARQQVSSLSESCVLLRRETLNRVGYLDEGYEDASQQIADYCLRVKLQGYSLICAQDAYLYADKPLATNASAAASSPTKEQAKRYKDSVLMSNLAVEASSKYTFADEIKWGDPSPAFVELVSKFPSRMQANGKFGESRFYPEKVAVQGLSGTVYWVEEGIRRPIEGEWSKPVIRLSQLDLWRWPIGQPVQSDAAIRTGKLYQTADGSVYYLENGKKRPFINAYAQAAWCLQEGGGAADLTQAEFEQMRVGNPIIAPVQLRQSL